jgi:hypothetical protein
MCLRLLAEEAIGQVPLDPTPALLLSDLPGVGADGSPTSPLVMPKGSS